MVTRVKDATYSITLTEDEVYTLQILLGFVACDKQCGSIAQKLSSVSGEEMDCEDYDRVSFYLDDEATGIADVRIEENVTIRFN